MRVMDVMITKPSELAFYPVPKIMYERVEAYKQIQVLLIERGPILIPYFYAQLGAISNKFTDFQMKSFPGRSDLSTVRLADQ
jgi:hypothetical protein